MTALEEIKKAEHERIWLEPAGAPDRCWCQDNQWGDEGVEYVLASTLDGSQAEEKRLRTIALDMQAGYREAIARAEAAEAEVKRLRERLKPFSEFAGVLFERNFNRTDSVAEMTDVDNIPHLIFAGSFFDARQALASTGGEHNAE